MFTGLVVGSIDGICCIVAGNFGRQIASKYEFIRRTREAGLTLMATKSRTKYNVGIIGPPSCRLIIPAAAAAISGSVPGRSSADDWAAPVMNDWADWNDFIVSIKAARQRGRGETAAAVSHPVWSADQYI